jgi:hypothetical protein
VISAYVHGTNVSVRAGSVQLDVSKLRNAIKYLEPWFEKWRLRLLKRRRTTLFWKKGWTTSAMKKPTLKVSRKNISWSNEVKCVGLILHRKLTYRSCINNAVSNANCRLGQLCHDKFSSAQINLALTYYKSVIRPVMTHSAPAWGYPAETHVSKLQVLE